MPSIDPSQFVVRSRPRTPTNTVQNVMRGLIWFGLFVVLGILTVVLASVVSAVANRFVPGMGMVISRTFYVIPEFERVVVLKLGEFVGVRGPGRFWVIPYPPFYESVAAQMDIRVQTRVITAAQTLTADNVPVGTEAVVFWRVEDPQQAALKVANYAEAVFLAANSALKDTIGTLELTDLLGSRDKVSEQLERIIDAQASSFGLDVSSVEITDVHVPQDLIQELSVLAQSRRSAQAKIAEADAEKAIAGKLEEASQLMGPYALEMYRLNVLERIGREEGSQIVVYGLSSDNRMMENTLAAAAAGSMVRSTAPGKKADKSGEVV
jgi:regulator of protease activity HflC (stomatin/prohibitin superfamily)